MICALVPVRPNSQTISNRETAGVMDALREKQRLKEPPL